MDQYLGLLGLPSAGALRASVGLASNVDDVERFLAFVELTTGSRDRHRRPRPRRQPSEEIMGDNGPGSARRLLGVFAHPDDEVFCAGGTMARAAEAGAEIMIVSATLGEQGQIRDPAAATRRTLGTVRERELRAAAAELGVAQRTCWATRTGPCSTIGSRWVRRGRC